MGHFEVMKCVGGVGNSCGCTMGERREAGKMAKHVFGTESMNCRIYIYMYGMYGMLGRYSVEPNTVHVELLRSSGSASCISAGRWCMSAKHRKNRDSLNVTLKHESSL